jgi:hypothetical protein
MRILTSSWFSMTVVALAGIALVFLYLDDHIRETIIGTVILFLAVLLILLYDDKHKEES